MRQPEFITFTGIDDRTDLVRADRLAAQFPIEWGVLVSAASRDARFPSQQAVVEIMDIAGTKSAHLCGKVSREAQKGHILNSLNLNSFDRVQVNGYGIDTAFLPEIESEYDVNVILQSRTDTFQVSDFLQLYDCSGGVGRMPSVIPPIPSSTPIVGYAGGMGPDTVVDYLLQLDGSGKFWIDMEGNVRTDGWFDLDKAERVCDLIFG